MLRSWRSNGEKPSEVKDVKPPEFKDVEQFATRMNRSRDARPPKVYLVNARVGEPVPESDKEEGSNRVNGKPAPLVIGREKRPLRENTANSERSDLIEDVCPTPQCEASLGDSAEVWSVASDEQAPQHKPSQESYPSSSLHKNESTETFMSMSSEHFEQYSAQLTMSVGVGNLGTSSCSSAGQQTTMRSKSWSLQDGCPASPVGRRTEHVRASRPSIFSVRDPRPGRRYSMPLMDPAHQQKLQERSREQMSQMSQVSQHSVAHKWSCSSHSSVVSSAQDVCPMVNHNDTAHLTAQLEIFREIRAQEQEGRHNTIFAFGASLIVVGSIIEGCKVVHEWPGNGDGGRWSTPQPPFWIAVILFPIGILIFSSGVLAVTINPLGDFDVNAFIGRHPRGRIFICLFLALRSLVLGVAPPHFSAIAAGPALWRAAKGIISLFRTRKQKFGKKRWKKGNSQGLGSMLTLGFGGPSLFPLHFTTLLTGILAVWASGNALKFLYMAYISSTHEETPVIPAFHWLILAGCHILMIIVWLGLCFRRRSLHLENNYLEFAALTESLYEAIYGYLFLMGVFSLWAGILPLYFNDEATFFIGIGRFLSGLAYLAPLSMLLVFNRGDILPFFISRCHRNKGDRERERDGAFLAAMLDSVIFEVGRPWWVHRPNGQVDNNFPKEDHRHFWQRGVIERMEEDKFFVKLKGEEAEVKQNVAARQATSKELLELARLNLRCIDWKELTLDVLKGDLTTSNGLTTSDGAAKKARPVLSGEIIDFFVSHSWYDDAELKYSKLETIADEFILSEGREPTFWLDHVCIDQTNILDGLKVLPVNILGCRRFIALCGNSYLKRLWCAWELCTLMAFLDQLEDVLDCVLLVPVAPGGDKACLRKFLSFDILGAKCYDPNEQQRVFAVVHTIGVGHFNHMVRELGRTLLSSGPTADHNSSGESADHYSSDEIT